MKSQRRHSTPEIDEIIAMRRFVRCSRFRDTGRTAWTRIFEPLENLMFPEAIASIDQIEEGGRAVAKRGRGPSHLHQQKASTQQ